MKRFFNFLTAKWFVTLVGAIALSLVVWFIGPLIAVGEFRPFDSDLGRMIAIMAILVVWGLVNVLGRAKEAKTNKDMVATLTEAQAGKGADAASAEEVALLKTRIEEALQVLRKTSQAKGAKYLYQLPWYMIIGPPGAGKTTALVNSGLNFPLAAKYGKDPVKGVGGTRNCDWWFTDEAVLIDTAGRYTTQDSDASVDQAAWKGFLGLLKKFRPRQPINGALVAISLSDVALMPAADRLSNAHAIRARLKELQDEFGVRFPVYVLFTKSDLVAGFVEFFDNLGKEEREQVWGMTFALDESKGEDAAPVIGRFGAEFDALVARLNDNLLDRIQAETDIGKRTLIWGFPAQIASLRQPLQEFLDEIFMPNRYEGRPLLRGIYLTSGTQEGTPIDRMMSAVAATFGIDRQRLSGFSGAGRSYFLTRLLKGVVFPEASIVSANPRVEKRQALLRWGAYAAAAVVVLGLGAAWSLSYVGNRGLIGEVEARVADYGQKVQPVASTVVADGDLVKALPALDALRDMPAGYAQRDASAPVSLTFGLYQGDKLGQQEIAAYRKALNTVFLPRLLVRTADLIRTNIGNADYVQTGLKVYLMLGGQGPLEKDLIRGWFTEIDWPGNYAGQQNQGLRERLALHLDAMLEWPLAEIELDGRVIDAARRVLLQTPMAGRAYQQIRQSAEARALPEWRLADHAGPAADRALRRASGKPFAEGVPGFYTREGFWQVFVPKLATISRDTAKERWVLGDKGGSDDAVSQKLEQDVATLYMTDYAQRWDQLLADVGIVPIRSLPQASEVLNVLSGPTSPLKLFLVDVAKETKLTQPPEPPGGGAGQAVAGAAAKAAGPAAAKLATLAAKAVPKGPELGQAVDDRFQRLHEFVGLGKPPGQPAPIDDFLRSLNDVYLALNQAVATNNPKAAGPAAARLASEASRTPPALATAMATLATSLKGIGSGDLKATIADGWRTNVLPFCRQALDNRYPIKRDSQVDVTIDDFTQLFAPGGKIDAFFNANLKPYVDTTKSPWRVQKVDDVELSIASDALAQFERAARIRDSFFAPGTPKPQMKFVITPVTLDNRVTQVLLELEGQELTYAHGPPRAVPVQWPGVAANNRGRVAFQPQPAGQSASITKSGPWALFRLFDEGRVEQGQLTDKARVTFDVGGRKVTYELQANSVINPLTSKELGEFRCPAIL
jgi:type VI secretion system protein ImpL